MTEHPPSPPPAVLPIYSVVRPGETAAAAVIPFEATKKARAKERWSANVIDRGYTMIPTILLWGQAKLGLTPDELNVLLQIMSHWFYQGSDPHPAKTTIADRMGKHPRTVQAYLTSLENKGFIARVRRQRASKGQDSNGYDLSGLLAKLEAIAPEFKKVSEQNKIRRRKVEKASA